MDSLRTDITTTSNAYLQSISMEEGRIRPAIRWSYDIMYYDYFEKDHLGNVRVVLTDQHQQDVYPVADMESGNTAALNTEKQYYDIQDGNITDEGDIPAFLLRTVFLQSCCAKARGLCCVRLHLLR